MSTSIKLQPISVDNICPNWGSDMRGPFWFQMSRPILVDCAAASTDPMYMGSRSFQNDVRSSSGNASVGQSFQSKCFLGVAWQGPICLRRNPSRLLLNFHHIPSLLGAFVHFLMSLIQSLLLPIGSMYGIYANIWGILMVNVTIYSSTMDPMGCSVQYVPCFVSRVPLSICENPAALLVVESPKRSDIAAPPMFLFVSGCIRKIKCCTVSHSSIYDSVIKVQLLMKSQTVYSC